MTILASELGGQSSPQTPSTPDQAVTAVATWIKSDDPAVFDLSISERSDEPDDQSNAPKVTGLLVVHGSGVLEFQLSSEYRFMRDRVKKSVTFFRQGDQIALLGKDAKWALLKVSDFGWVSDSTSHSFQLHSLSRRLTEVVGKSRDDSVVGEIAQRAVCLVDPRKVATVEQFMSSVTSRKVLVRQEKETVSVHLSLTNERARALDAFNDGAQRMQPLPRDRTEGAITYVEDKDNAIVTIRLQFDSYYYDDNANSGSGATGVPIKEGNQGTDSKSDSPLCITREVIFAASHSPANLGIPNEVRKILGLNESVK